MKRADLEKFAIPVENGDPVKLDKTTIDAIMALHGKGIEATKTSVAELEKNVENLTSQLNDANAKIDQFKDMKSPEDVEKAIGDWKTKLQEAETAHNEAVKKLRFDHALENAVNVAGAKSIKAVKALINVDDLQMNEKDGSIIGLDTQIEALKESSGYLFSDGAQDPKIVDGGDPKSVVTDADVDAFRAAANLGQISK